MKWLQHAKLCDVKSTMDLLHFRSLSVCSSA